ILEFDPGLVTHSDLSPKNLKPKKRDVLNLRHVTFLFVQRKRERGDWVKGFKSIFTKSYPKEQDIDR
ncbi:unnamed protein product, partial [marine sediment metagenome]